MKKWGKWVAGVLGGLVIGAFSNGLWDLAFKPLAQRTRQAILTIVTFGSATLRDQIYREAAKGFHEAAAAQVLDVLTVAVLSLFAGMGMYLFSFVLRSTPSEKREEIRSETEIAAEIARLEHENSSLQRPIRLKKKVLSVVLSIVVAELALMAGIYLIIRLKIDEANNAYTFFAQSMTICRPYITDHDAYLLQSRFASIQGKADYIAVANSLRAIAKANQQWLPKFEPW
jgi:hypothetical protein